MAIEVRQMIVKTSVVHRSVEAGRHPDEKDQTPSPDLRRVLEHCRRLVAEMLRERRER